MEEEKNKVGWECPRCHKIHSPDIKTCSCNIKERTKKKSEEKLLNE